MKPKFIALLPFILFLIVFVGLNLMYPEHHIIRDNFPLFAAFVAIIASFFTFQKQETITEKVDVFIQGATQSIIVHMCFIFYLSTVFTNILEQIGGIQSAVNLCLTVIPSWAVLPGIFMVTSLFSFTVGTSMGAIAAFMPIATNIATHVLVNPSCMAATVVCGAMFGDNLSILSDTTIAAVKITHASMKDKFILNGKIALPAFLGSFCILLYQNYLLPTAPVFQVAATYQDFIKILPYALVFYCACKGIDILVTLVLGTVVTIGLGFYFKSLTLLHVINLIFDGFYTSKAMVNIFVLVLVLAGLSNIITYNGGIEYILAKLEHTITKKQYAQYIILLLITCINMTIGINTISILVTGPLALKLSEKYNINPTYTACILDIGSCISQGLLPYAPQLLLAASMAHVSSISLLPYLYYQYLLTITLGITIAYNRKQQ